MQKDRLVFKFSVLPFVLLGCCAWMNKAQASGYLPPRLSLDANAGGSATVGQADLLLSLKGDERRNLYLDPQASYGTDEQWYADLGLGYRWIQNDAAILGGYLFAGHSQVANQSGFWIANPGVEALGSRWDARINGYIPIGSRGDDKGISQFVLSRKPFYTGHTAQIITSYVNVDETQQIGDGVDAKVGYQVFRNVPFKAYLGAYFFDIHNTDNVRGGAAGLEYWFDHTVKVFANYTYDNLQHSTLVGGLAVSFGGVNESRADPSLSERLTDPVERYLANLGHGSGIPSEMILSTVKTGSFSTRISLTPALTTMAFFSQNGTPNNGGAGLSMANCTYENPCGPTDFSQTGINTLYALIPNTTMLFNGGAYPATNGPSALTLNNGQGVFGMNVDYSAPAQGAARSTFNGAFILNGNNTLDSIILNNSLGASRTAITSVGGQNIVINNATIGSAGTPYVAVMNLTNASATLSNSQVAATLFDPGGNALLAPRSTPIYLLNSALNVQGSEITGTERSPSGNNLVGIFVNTGSSLVLENSSVNIYGAPYLPFYVVSGIQVYDNTSVLITRGVINVAAGNAIGIGLLASNRVADTAFIEMIGRTINIRGGADSRVQDARFPGSIMVGGNINCLLNGMSVPCA